MGFIQSLLDFQVDSVPEKKWQKYRSTYLSNPDYNEDKVCAVLWLGLGLGLGLRFIRGLCNCLN
jgi:hypothetical protein